MVWCSWLKIIRLLSVDFNFVFRLTEAFGNDFFVEGSVWKIFINFYGYILEKTKIYFSFICCNSVCALLATLVIFNYNPISFLFALTWNTFQQIQVVITYWQNMLRLAVNLIFRLTWRKLFSMVHGRQLELGIQKIDSPYSNLSTFGFS